MLNPQQKGSINSWTPYFFAIKVLSLWKPSKVSLAGGLDKK